IRQINPTVPEWLASLIAVLHSKDPRRRFSSADEVARLLTQYAEHRRQPAQVPAPALPPPALPRAAVRPRRRRLAAVVVLLAAVATFFAVRPTVQAPGPDSILGGLSGPSLLKLQANVKLPDPLRAVAFSPDGELLAAACDDHTVRIYGTASRRV